MEFIYPSEMFNTKQVDSSYEEEYAIVSQKFKTHLIDIDNLENTKKIITEDKVLYRGWMLNENNYHLLSKKIIDNQGLSALLVNKDTYIASHYLPNWYSLIKELTIESLITTPEKAKSVMLQNAWENAFVKDYVKSLKSGKGSIIDSPEELSRIFEDMIKFKGNIEGGIVLRKVIDILPETEKRFFVLYDTVYAPDDTDFGVKLVNDVKERLLGTRPFYSVDVVKTKSDKEIVIEIGDGQVSDFVGWDIVRFTSVFNQLEYNNKKNLKV